MEKSTSWAFRQTSYLHPPAQKATAPARVPALRVAVAEGGQLRWRRLPLVRWRRSGAAHLLHLLGWRRRRRRRNRALGEDAFLPRAEF